MYSSGCWYDCYQVREDIAEKIIWHTLHDSRRTFEESLASGCELCYSIEHTVPRGSSDYRTFFAMSRGERNYCNQLAIIASADDTPNFSDAFKVQIEPFRTASSLEPVQSAAVAASKSRYTGSPATLQLASSWLKECATHHENCVPKSEPGWHPTRSLEVTGETVKLIDTADENVREHYFTLSYVWGNPTPPLMLTPEKEGELRAGLPIIRLEKTYRDALHLTKALGYRYLWIDLFCIFQGESAKGKQDWAQESPTMDQVYTHGLLNISATYASHGDGGCFTQVGDDDIIATPLCVSWAMTEGDPMSYHLLHLGYRRDRQKNALLDFENNSPVFTRGWTLQECMLATRVLHSAAKGIVWECCEGRAMHFSPFLPNNINLSDRLGPCAGSIAADSSTHLTTLWLRALYTYTRTNLT
jgi:hypothetical protein